MSSNPSFGPDVALATVKLAEMGRSGLMHVVGSEVISRFDFAKRIALGFGLDPSLLVGKKTAETAPATARPLQGGLTSDRLEAILPQEMKSLDKAIADFRRCAGVEGWKNPDV